LVESHAIDTSGIIYLSKYLQSFYLSSLYLKNAKQIKYHSLCGINGYLNLNKQSPKYEQSNTKDFGDEEETF
jgi:hypothetical protein